MAKRQQERAIIPILARDRQFAVSQYRSTAVPQYI